MNEDKKRRESAASSHSDELSRRIKRARQRAKRYLDPGTSLVDELLVERRLEARLDDTLPPKQSRLGWGPAR
jgi:hypothetical protein